MPAPSPIFDYVLYLGSLVWSLELGYIENRFHMLSGQSDLYLLATAGLFFSSLIVSTIASCCRSVCLHSPDGSGSPSRTGRPIRTLRIANMPFSTVCWSVSPGHFFMHRGLKPHFFDTYLNIVANVLFWALLSGVFNDQGYGLCFLALLIACTASVGWGLARRQFAFIAYAAVYGYVGFSFLFVRSIADSSAVLKLFRRQRSGYARGAGADRAPLREAGMRLYSASSEEILRARTLMTDWVGEGFLSKAQYQLLEQETVSDLRTTNIFLRMVLFLFTLISVGAAVGLFFVVFLC